MITAVQPPLALIWPNWLGRPATTEAKISSDMPLPMPRWVTSSPIHINRAVPVVRVSTINSTWPTSKLGTRSRPVVLPPRSPAPPLWNR